MSKNMTQKREFIPKELPLNFKPTEQIYKALNRASRKLGELNGFIKPFQTMIF